MLASLCSWFCQDISIESSILRTTAFQTSSCWPLQVPTLQFWCKPLCKSLVWLLPWFHTLLLSPQPATLNAGLFPWLTGPLHSWDQTYERVWGRQNGMQAFHGGGGPVETTFRKLYFTYSATVLDFHQWLRWGSQVKYTCRLGKKIYSQGFDSREI